jgi:hypothetical protein
MMPLDFKHNQSINAPVESELSLFGFVFGLRVPERLRPTPNRFSRVRVS